MHGVHGEGKRPEVIIVRQLLRDYFGTAIGTEPQASLLYKDLRQELEIV